MRIRLASSVDRAAIDALALANGWRLVQQITRRADRANELAFVSAQGSIVAFVDDARDGSRYVEIAGHDPSEVETAIRDRLECIGETSDDGLPAQPPSVPERPRLFEHVHGRMHVVDGEAKVILQDFRRGLVMEIEPASWHALTYCDGTRDIDALCLALARRDLYVGAADLVQLLVELNAAGVLADGLALPEPPPPVIRESTPLDRPLAVLPDFSLVCDGRGSCCRVYGSVTFTPLEEMRARLLVEKLDVPLHPDDLFMPIRGAQSANDDMRAVAQIDGRCAFLCADGRCGLHRAGGPLAKPFPCRFYPATLVDDGQHVRVSLGPECACIFASIGRSDGEPLIPKDARTLGDLGPAASVMQVPDPVPLSAHKSASRAELSSWSLRLCELLRDREPDAVCFAWALADAVAEHGLDLQALERACESTREPELEPWLSALAEHASGAAATQDAWRSAVDLSRRVARAMADALQAGVAHGAHDARGERFYLRALAFGHRLSLEGRTIEHGLRDRATRIAAARCMAVASDWQAPLALLEAAIRNLGLSYYADALQR